MSTELLHDFSEDQRRRGLQPNTRILRDRQLKLFEREVGPVELGNREDFSRFLDSRRTHKDEPICAKTRSCYLTTFSAFFAWGIEAELWTASPITKKMRPKTHNGLPNPISKDDFDRAFAKATPLLRCWLALERYAGLRCMEVSQLRRDDILVDERTIRIQHGKGDKARNVTLTNTILMTLNDLGMPERGRLWEASPANVSQRINRYLHSLGIQHTAHKLRHRFATDLYAVSGKDIIATAKGLGHANIQTTQIYARVDDSALREAMDKMDPEQVA